jgi:hypothetical protein
MSYALTRQNTHIPRKHTMVFAIACKRGLMGIRSFGVDTSGLFGSAEGVAS